MSKEKFYWHNVWDVIHIQGKTFDTRSENSRESFICFFECLGDLLPNLEYRTNLKNFMYQYPLSSIIFTAENTFEWSYRLHSYINLIKRVEHKPSSDISLTEAHSKYSYINKDDWARPTWFLIHFIARNLPAKIPPEQRIALKAFVVCLRYLLPCSICRNHMNEYISGTEIDSYLLTRDSFFFWTWRFHNEVNKRLGKRVIPLEEASRIYVLSN